MKKIYFIVALFVALSVTNVIAQNPTNPTAEGSSVVLTSTINQDAGRALWDVVFSYNMKNRMSTPTGMAGVVFFNNEFWVSKWGSDSIYKFTASGNFVNGFIIAGLTGIRAFTTDGLYIYAATNTNKISRINAVLQQLAPAQITVDTTVNFAVRFCSYDGTLNSGTGGFWVGNYADDLVAVDMNGNKLTAIPAATHALTGMYGAAVDNYTAGGPYIWVSDQGGAATSRIVQIKISTGLAVAVHEIIPDINATDSITSGLAGGAFIGTNIVPDKVVFVTLLQGAPTNVLLGYEVGDIVSGIVDNEKTSIAVYPNPANNLLTISCNSELFNATFTIFDLAGKQILHGILQGNSTNVDIASVAAGAYLVEISSNGVTLGKKLVVKS